MPPPLSPAQPLLGVRVRITKSGCSLDLDLPENVGVAGSGPAWSSGMALGRSPEAVGGRWGCLKALEEVGATPVSAWPAMGPLSGAWLSRHC